MLEFLPDAETLSERRRHLHRHPELAFQERSTSEYAARLLADSGWNIAEGVGGTGLVARLDLGRPGRHVLLRVEMDALPVSDETTNQYRSIFSGTSHACGHDGHMAVVLSVAEWLAANASELAGAVTCVFQPAEETLQGAQAMIQEGLLERGPFDAMLGFHLWNFLPVGTVGVRAGASHAGVERVDVNVTGTGGHGGMPHLAVDAGFVLTEVMGVLTRLVTRIASPLEPVTLTFGEIRSGSAYNVLPATAFASGTLRTLNPDLHKELRSAIQRAASLAAEIYGANADCSFSGGVPSVVSNSDVAEVVAEAAAKVVGENRVVQHTPVMGGDDVSYMLERIPGCYFVVGSQRRNGNEHPTHHHPAFDFEEEAMPIAATVLARSTMALLAR